MSIKKGTMPPRYDDAFKSGAIKMVTEQGRPSKEVAAELGICVETRGCGHILGLFYAANPRLCLYSIGLI